MTGPYVRDPRDPRRVGLMYAYDNASKVRRVCGRASMVSDINSETLLDGLDPCYLEDPISTRRRNRHPPLVKVLTV